MKADSKSGSRSRVDFRVPVDVKAKLQEAAVCENGGDLSAFLIAAGIERADRVLARQEVVSIEPEMRAQFYAAMREPGTPSEALRRLMTEEHAGFRLVE